MKQKRITNICEFTKRLLPGEDLKEGIEELAKKNKIEAGCIVSIVGNLKKATLRLAGGRVVRSWNQLFEIVSGTGTVSVNGCHIHVSISDRKGNVIGGHLKKGCIVNTTAEIVLLEFGGTTYKRTFDRKTGYDELVIK